MVRARQRSPGRHGGCGGRALRPGSRCGGVREASMAARLARFDAVPDSYLFDPGAAGRGTGWACGAFGRIAMMALGRRRFVAISAAAAALGGGAPAMAVPLHVWQGTALGAMASIRLAHPDPVAARRLIEGCLAEIARLEAIFSLYRAGFGDHAAERGRQARRASAGDAGPARPLCCHQRADRRPVRHHRAAAVPALCRAFRGAGGRSGGPASRRPAAARRLARRPALRRAG